MAGVRPQQWDPQFVKLAEAVQHPPAAMLLTKVYVLRYWLDCGDLDRTADAVNAMVAVYDNMRKLVRQDVAAELAFYFAFIRHDPEQAQHYLSDASGGERHRFFRAKAAILARSSDFAGARTAVQQARASLQCPLLDSTALDRDLIDAIERELPADSGAVSERSRRPTSAA